MERETALFLAGREGFYRENAYLNCRVDVFCACEGANSLFNVDEVMGQRLVSVGEGIRISEPVGVPRGLRCEGKYFYASISHNGVVAIYSATGDILFHYEYKEGDGMNMVQFTDMNADRQVELEVESVSLVGFYDDRLILLTKDRPLREAGVEGVFEEPSLSEFERIGDVESVSPFADVSLLNSTRALLYTSTGGDLFSYDVDARSNKGVPLKGDALPYTSLTGIGCGVGTMFEATEREIYILRTDGTAFGPLAKSYMFPNCALPSNSEPSDLGRMVLMYGSHLSIGEREVIVREPIMFDGNQSVVRVYRDVFLVFDKGVRRWVLSRIIVP